MLVVADPNLVLPRVYQWSVGLDQAIARDQIVSASYVGAAGRRLLRGELLVGFNPDFGDVSVIRNTGSSDYHALQLEYRRRLSGGLRAMAAYTWAQSLDTASDETFRQNPAAVVDVGIDRGPSNFDIRHAFSAAATYALPSISVRGLGDVMRDWSIDLVARARSAAPVNVVGCPSSCAGQPVFGVRAAMRPDLVPGVPLYLDDPTVAGGRRINRAAFSMPPPGRQGNLTRNALRGFAVSQVDLSLRRRFALPDRRMGLEFRVDAFNVLNHPNFADPNGFLSDATFGESLQMFGRGLGGLSPLYQIGGPRSIQLALRMTF